MTIRRLLLIWILLAPVRGMTYQTLHQSTDGSPVVYYLDRFEDREDCQFAADLFNEGIWNGQQYPYLGKLARDAVCLPERDDNVPNSVHLAGASS